MEHQHTRAHQSGDVHYRHLLIMLALSFAVMYALMYAMVDDFANVFNSVNQVYMVAPMGIIELAVMRSMYANRRLNLLVAAGSAVVLALAWFGIRQQVAIGDAQFLRSMIPHHAILMCEEAPLQDAGIKALCQSIIASQQAEIAQMKARLAALAR